VCVFCADTTKFCERERKREKKTKVIEHHFLLWTSYSVSYSKVLSNFSITHQIFSRWTQKNCLPSFSLHMRWVLLTKKKGIYEWNEHLWHRWATQVHVDVIIFWSSRHSWL
jgi:hypothetical protein